MDYLVEDPYDYIKSYPNKEEEIILDFLHEYKDKTDNSYIKTIIDLIQRGYDNNNIKFMYVDLKTPWYYKLCSPKHLPKAGFFALRPFIKYIQNKYDELERDHKEVKTIRGYYDSKKNKLFVKMSHIEDRDKVYINDKVLLIFLHEMIHMLAFNKSKIFVHLFEEEILIPFYRNLIKELCPKVKDVDTVADFVLRELILNESNDRNLKNPALNIYKVYPDVGKIFIEHFINISKGFADVKKTKKLQDSIRKSYNSDMVMRGSFIPYQELIYPSEVVGIYALYEPEREVFKKLLTVM